VGKIGVLPGSYRYPDVDDSLARAAIAELYDGAARRQWDEEDARLVRAAASRIAGRTSVRIADIGGGTGRLLSAIASLGDSVVIVEPDARRLGAALAEATRLQVRNCRFVREDLVTFATRACQKFDLVICSHVLQHLATDARPSFCAALAEITAPRSVLLMTLPGLMVGPERFLITQPSGPGAALTVPVAEDEFDEAVATGRHGLPVWHAGVGQVRSLLGSCGLDVLVERPYRGFWFAVNVEGVGRKFMAGADMMVIATPANRTQADVTVTEGVPSDRLNPQGCQPARHDWTG
jgi:SAM-dependent methyltransferase